MTDEDRWFVWEGGYHDDTLRPAVYANELPCDGSGKQSKLIKFSKKLEGEEKKWMVKELAAKYPCPV